MARGWMIAVAALGGAMMAPAPAAAAQSTVIEGAFTETHRRLDCDCRPITWTRHFRITLSGRNSVHEEWTSRSDRNLRTESERDRELGKTEDRGVWRVLGANRLERTKDHRQHQLILTITTHEKSCDLRVEYRLKPGYSDVLAKRADNGQWAHFSLPRVLAQSCEIH